MKDLGTLGGAFSQAFGINDLGQITGQAYTKGGFGAHAFLYDGGTMHDLGTIRGPYSNGLGINHSGVVVGESNFTSGSTATHAFVYRNGRMEDLNRLIPANSGWVLSTAYGINEAGEIVGYGTHTHQQRGFLLTPQ